jgi:hypothetical protein
MFAIVDRRAAVDFARRRLPIGHSARRPATPNVTSEDDPHE